MSGFTLEIIDHTDEVISEKDAAVDMALEMIGGEAEKYSGRCFITSEALLAVILVPVLETMMTVQCNLTHEDSRKETSVLVVETACVLNAVRAEVLCYDRCRCFGGFVTTKKPPVYLTSG